MAGSLVGANARGWRSQATSLPVGVPAGGTTAAEMAVRWAERLAALAIAAMLVSDAMPIIVPMATPDDAAAKASIPVISEPWQDTARDSTLLAGYIGVPEHNRSDVHIVRPDGTDLKMKSLRWDGEPFVFPIYAGVRAVKWHGAVGGMIDFLHDKAVTRVGKGAHGKKVTGERAIVDTVELEGTIKGQPAPASAKITDILERLEFTHGHNMLMPTALLRLGAWASKLRPYVGIGYGVALPHVEVWPTGEGEAAKTNEYQAAGPAFQIVAGLELEGARGAYFLEYKFTSASLDVMLTGGKTPSWCNCDFVSDSIRHIGNWWRGEKPKYGSLSTSLVTHQIVGGAGYRLGSGAVKPAPR